MYGILTADADLAREGPGDVAYYFAEQVSGRRQSPLEDAVNSVACWGDTALVEEDRERAAVSADGTNATPEADGHHWGTVCPTDPDYREELLDRIEQVGAVGDVRLTTVGFPGEEFCHCGRCERQFGETDADWPTWRSSVITKFVADASDRVDGDLVATLYPDPYPGHLQERAGLDPKALASHVDGFLVPLCSVGYETTYWVESLARGFASELDGLDASLTFQLSASEAGADRLAALTRRVEPYADAVVFGTHRAEIDVVEDAIGSLQSAEPAPSPS